MNQNDLRVIKTKQNIENSFVSLLEQKDFHKITVQDILDKALINRTTFYKHYADKYQLACTICDRIFKLFQSSVQERFSCTEKNEIMDVLKTLYKGLSLHRKEILSLLKVHTDTIHLYDDLIVFLKDSYRCNNPKTDLLADDITDYLSTIYAVQVMATIQWCLENDGYETLVEHEYIFLQLADIF